MKSESVSKKENSCFCSRLTIILLSLLFSHPAVVVAMDANHLFKAVDAGNAEGVREALQNLAEVNASRTKSRGLSKETPLFIAVTKGDLEVAKILLSHGADTNHATLFHESSLIYIAIEQSNTEMVH